MKRTYLPIIGLIGLLIHSQTTRAQITKLNDYSNYNSAVIGTFQGIKFREGGFSGLFPIVNTNGKEFWTCSDRGVNVDAANANLPTCRPTYDKIYGFPGYAPKIHRIRINGDSLQILQTITMKRPLGTTATGLLNPTGFGSTALEQVSTDTVQNCANFSSKTAAKDIWGIDAEGIVVDKNGNFWICEEGGPTIWKLNYNGVVVKRFTPYSSQSGAQPQDVAIDTVFRTRKNNRGFEGIAITPSGKIYAIIQSPLLNPTKSVGENTSVHRILEIDPVTSATRMLVYLNDGVIGSSGSNQIRLRDWKIGDMAAINDSTFLVLEAALRGTSDIKRLYTININGATAVSSGTYGGLSVEALVDATGLASNGITPVKKTLFMDLLANGWSATLEKAEGIAIVNDSTLVIGNDNDYGQWSPAEDGTPLANNVLSHVVKFGLKGSNKLSGFKFTPTLLSQGATLQNSSTPPFHTPAVRNAHVRALLTVGNSVNGYKMVGIPDGMGAYSNRNGTFTMLLNHELSVNVGVVRKHGNKGAFVSKWIVDSATLKVISGEDLISKVNVWNSGTGTYTEYTASNPVAASAFARFCAGDLPAVSAFYNEVTGLGTKERIFMNGEESGNEGRAFGHIATGVNTGTSWELPALGKFSWENGVANPATGDKTVVAGMDDATPGQVYFYSGTKQSSGTEIEKAGLTNGKLYGPVVQGMALEVNASIPDAETPFSMVNLGAVKNATGAALQASSVASGVTSFLRPEDGAWDPANPADFYFVTTNAFNAPSRLWKMHFSELNDIAKGGTITAVLSGTEGQQMMDNVGFDNSGHLIIQEDPGNQTHLAKMWQYNLATDELKQILRHDSAYFLSSSSNFLTHDEEGSGVIDAQELLGPGMLLAVDQVHYGIPGELVEGGQMIAIYNPSTYAANPEVSVWGNGTEILDNDLTPSATDHTLLGTVNQGEAAVRVYRIFNYGPGPLKVRSLFLEGSSAFSIQNAGILPLRIDSGKFADVQVKFSPQSAGIHQTMLHIVSNDYNEPGYNFNITGIGAATAGTSINDEIQTTVIGPNPASGLTHLYFNMPSDGEVTVKILDQGGKMVYNQAYNFDAGNQALQLPLTGLSNGIYHVQLIKGAQSESLKLIVTQ